MPCVELYVVDLVEKRKAGRQKAKCSRFQVDKHVQRIMRRQNLTKIDAFFQALPYQSC